ncbi:short-chain dehydrogenase reductase/reductase family protein [Fusarium bulbicola]|nr:short-chain dehydrogenase reductase/reductase family protein [Fusarium bulbicola]
MTTILVTGANRGIGYAIVQAIATRLPSSTIVLGCRSKNAAQEAVESLIDSGIQNKLSYVELDIENDASIGAAVVSLQREYGKLDVLINNAGKVEPRSSDNLADIRAASNSCFNNLITSNAVVTHAFGKLLRRSAEPRVIMISSARGSMARTNNKELPPVANIDYCVSKVGLNMLMLHLQAAENHSEDEPKMKFWAQYLGATYSKKIMKSRASPTNEIQSLGSCNVPSALPCNAYVFNASTEMVHLRPIAQGWAYTAVKATVLKISEYMQDDNPEWHVVQIQPGVVRTELNARFDIVGQDDPSLAAHFYVWLASLEADFLNGKFVRVNCDVDESKARADEIEDSFILKVILDGVPI